MQSCSDPFKFLRVFAVMAMIAASSGAAWAQAGGTTQPKAREPSPIEDDANLHDVQFVDSRHGWAAGDRGVIWYSADGGETWALQQSGVSCPLESVCFLSDRVGWIAGGGTIPFTRQSYGVILRTSDGGGTWQPLVAPPPAVTGNSKPAAPTSVKNRDQKPVAAALPRIKNIQFFSLDEAVAVCEATGAEPVGVYATQDAGKSWLPLAGKAASGWLAAEFVSPELGALAGTGGAIARAIDGKIVPSRLESLGRQALYDMTLRPGGQGWLVGDGGLVLSTENAGLVWQDPEGTLPPAIRDAFDFRAVSSRGGQVWVAGDPGTVIWHSPDAGKNWHPRKTGQALPLAALHFSSESRGCAVGALGTILRTADGGRTWKTTRGSGRRLAFMALSGSTQQISLGLIAEASGESGYRSLVSVVAGQENGSGDAVEMGESARLDEAVTRAGGSATRVGWQLPLPTPGLERDFERLVADWNRRTDNRLTQILVGGLVRQLRTWRPNVLVIESPQRDDAFARLVNEVALQAVEQAADTSAFPEQRELADLSAWQVEKIYQRLPIGSSGHANVDPFRYLPHLRSANHVVASTAESLVRDIGGAKASRQAYRLVAAADPELEKSPAGPIFAGLSIPTGAARRSLGAIDDSDIEALRKIAARQRDFAAYTDRNLSDSRHAGQLIAQLPEIVRGLPDADGAWQIARLAEQYQAVGQWELSELALVELIEKYPAQPAAVEAMQRLVQLWGSAEVTWRRLRSSTTEERREQNRPDVTAQAVIRQVEARLQKQARSLDRTIFDDEELGNDPAKADSGSESTSPEAEKIESGRVIRKNLDQQTRWWQTRALKMARELERRDVALAAEPAVQFPLAAIYRQQTAFSKSDAVYRRFIERGAAAAWWQAAAGEIWLSSHAAVPPGPTSICGFTAERPVLDGLLADPCWQDAAEVPLEHSTVKSADKRRPAVAMFAFDAEYFYFALTVPRVEGLHRDAPTEAHRRHDEDLSEYDRVRISLDIDRDYVTAFNFVVDQRGCTAESCCLDPSWDPHWFVAAAADTKQWCIEAAIPLDELTPLAPRKGSAWAIGITRIMPAVGVESWTSPAAASVHLEAAGVLMFDAPPGAR